MFDMTVLNWIWTITSTMLAGAAILLIFLAAKDQEWIPSGLGCLMLVVCGGFLYHVVSTIFGQDIGVWLLGVVSAVALIASIVVSVLAIRDSASLEDFSSLITAILISAYCLIVALQFMPADKFMPADTVSNSWSELTLYSLSWLALATIVFGGIWFNATLSQITVE